MPRQTVRESAYEPVPADPSLRFFRIVEPGGKKKWIGSVQLQQAFFASQNITELVKFEFCILSASKLRRRGWQEHPHKPSDTVLIDEKPISYLWNKSKWCMPGLDVAMTERRREVLAYRLGLGKVRYVDWEKVKAERMLIAMG